jgi:hypothetical protein
LKTHSYLQNKQLHFLLLIILLSNYGCCHPNVEIVNLYAEQAILNFDQVTTIHVELDREYGPIFIGVSEGYLINESGFLDTLFSLGEREPNNHYDILFLAPSNETEVKILVYDPKSNGDCQQTEKSIILNIIDEK